MSDALALKPFAVIFQEPGKPPLFLSPFWRSRSVLIENGGLEPHFTMDHDDAEQLIARLRRSNPNARSEIVEASSLDPAAMARRHDASLPVRAQTKRYSENYGSRLAARVEADNHFAKRRTFSVEHKHKARRVAGLFDRDLIRKIMEKISERADAREGCYVANFSVPGYNSELVRRQIDFLVQQGYLEIAAGPSGGGDALSRFRLTDKGGDWLYAVSAA